MEEWQFSLLFCYENGINQYAGQKSLTDVFGRVLFFLFFFSLSRFSFTDTGDSEDNKGMEGTFFYSTLHFYPLTNIQIFIASVIRQKGESLNGCFKKTKHVKFSEKTNISNSLIRTRTCAYQGVRNVRFFGIFDVLCFLETPV